MRRLTLPQQALELRYRFDGRVRLRPGHLSWTGVLEPSSMSRRYEVQILYRLGHHPDVRVLEPKLVPNADGILPHFYPDSRTLCLYDAGEWGPHKFIAQTIVPWTSEWLLHYELWSVTGRWYGSGDDMAWATRPRRAA